MPFSRVHACTIVWKLSWPVMKVNGYRKDKTRPKVSFDKLIVHCDACSPAFTVTVMISNNSADLQTKGKGNWAGTCQNYVLVYSEVKWLNLRTLLGQTKRQLADTENSYENVTRQLCGPKIVQRQFNAEWSRWRTRKNCCPHTTEWIQRYTDISLLVKTENSLNNLTISPFSKIGKPSLLGVTRKLCHRFWR